MSTSIEIRQAQHADRSALLFFHRQLYMEYRQQITPPELEELYAYRDLPRALRDDVDALLHRPETVVFIAERSGEPCGYISGHVERDDRRVLPKKGVVEDWFVVDDARAQGLGGRLLKRLLDHFRTAGCQVAESATWPFNDAGRAAHMGAGFSEVEVRFRRPL